MHPRNLILTALAGGPLIGLLLGLAIDPAMKPAPEPGWHKIDPDPIFTEPQRIVDAGPQDLSPTWYIDRMPTWKRRAAMREAAMYEQAMYWPADIASYHEPEPLDERATVTVVRGSARIGAVAPRRPSPLDHAAEEAEAAARQASAAIVDVPPAAVAAPQEDGDEDGAESIVAIELPRQAGT